MLNEKEYEYYKIICRMTEIELLKWLRDFIVAHGYDTYTSTEDFLVAKGDIEVILVAHCDTVWEKPPVEIYYDREQDVIWSPQGGTGDDRSGVYAIVKLIQDGYRPHLVFTTDEEVGCIVSKEIAKQYEKPFPKAKYMIQIDRQGRNDCVFYSNGNELFMQYVESFGFHKEEGSYTDVEFLGPAWNIAYTNLSAGYVREHSVEEVVHVDWLNKTIAKVEEMLDDADNIAVPYDYVKRTRYLWTYDAVCECCGRIIPYDKITYFDDDILLCEECEKYLFGEEEN